MAEKSGLPRRLRPRVWKDEDDDWLWVCRHCHAVGPIERVMQPAFESAWRHASTHSSIGFRRAA